MGRFRFEDDHRYAMPAHFGGLKHVGTTTTYRDVTSLIVRYRTEKDAVDAYVPEALEVTDPVLSVAFVMNRGVEWMAGGGYNLVAVNVPVREANRMIVNVSPPASTNGSINDTLRAPLSVAAPETFSSSNSVPGRSPPSSTLNAVSASAA